MAEDQQRIQHRYWTLAIAGVCLVAISTLVFVVPLFTVELNAYFVFAIPAGFYLAAQGTIVIFAVLVFWVAGQQETLDRKLGAAEDN